MSSQLLLSALKIVIVIALSSFMVATVLTFLRIRLQKKEREFKNVLRVLGIRDEEVLHFTSSIKDEYAARDYLLPTAFATFVCLAGFTALLFGRELVSINPGSPNLILTGAMVTGLTPEEVQAMRSQGMLALTMAYLGAFIWSARNIVRRLINGDLTPSTYYSSSIRVIFASLVALMLSFVLNSLPSRAYTGELLPVVAFLAGMVPEQALVYIRDKVGIFSRSREETADELPLDMIEGINAFNKVRLGEVEVDNSQNLAEANLIDLLLKTPFNAEKLVDWIAQAKLLLYFKPVASQR